MPVLSGHWQDSGKGMRNGEGGSVKGLQSREGARLGGLSGREAPAGGLLDLR